MKQRMVNVKFWDDTYIMGIDPIEKLLFLYLLTNPLTNLSGIYEISLRRIAFDTGIDSKMIGRMFERFEKDQKIIFKQGWIWIVNFIKNQNTNPSILKGIQRQLDEIPTEIHDTLGTGWVQGGYRLGELNLTKLNLTKRSANDDIDDISSSAGTTNEIISNFRWNKILKEWRGAGRRVVGKKKLVTKKDGSQWLIGQNGTWEKYVHTPTDKPKD